MVKKKGKSKVSEQKNRNRTRALARDRKARKPAKRAGSGKKDCARSVFESRAFQGKLLRQMERQQRRERNMLHPRTSCRVSCKEKKGTEKTLEGLAARPSPRNHVMEEKEGERHWKGVESGYDERTSHESSTPYRAVAVCCCS